MAGKQPELKSAFVCQLEASELLNCVASDSFNEARCLTLLKKFRKCVEKERVAKFTLVPDSEPQPTPEQQTQASSSADKDKPAAREQQAAAP